MPVSTECRVYKRYDCEVPTWCQPTSASETRWNATILEISQTGLRMRLRRRFEPRSGLAIDLPGRDGDEPYTVYVKVVHVQRDPDGMWNLGCELMSELSEEELERLVTPKETIIPDVRLRIGLDDWRQSVHCNVKRFHFAGAWPLTAGKVLNLRGIAANGSHLDQQFEVVQCSPRGESWAVHIQPVDPDATPAWLDRYCRSE